MFLRGIDICGGHSLYFRWYLHACGKFCVHFHVVSVCRESSSFAFHMVSTCLTGTLYLFLHGIRISG